MRDGVDHDWWNWDSGCPTCVAVVQSSDLRNSDDLGATLRKFDLARFGRVLPKTQVATAFVVVGPIRIEDFLEMPSVKRDDVVHALSSD